MLHYLHITSMCVAACIICWGLAVVWQEDVKEIQCKCLLWVVFLPASYLVHLNNFKAYRLSTFLKAVDIRPKPFPHSKVMLLTLYWTFLTIIILIICAFVDPPTRYLAVSDKYRPALNRYQCTTGNVTPVLLTLLCSGHFVASVACVIAVRNGMEAFRDGMVIKESFFLLYAFLICVLVLYKLNLSSIYLLRTVCLSLGVTLFCLRLLISRCIRYWLPEYFHKLFHRIHRLIIQPLLYHINPSTSISVHSHSEHFISALSGIDEDNLKQQQEDSPVFQRDTPSDNNLNEMMVVLGHPERAKLFESVAKKALCLENVEFLLAVMKYQKEAARLLTHHSCSASEELKSEAQIIVKNYINANSDQEVNVSSKTRGIVEKHTKEWPINTPLLTPEKATELMNLEYVKSRVNIFDPAVKEIGIMLYQNLWNKFRTIETQALAAGCKDGDELKVVDA